MKKILSIVLIALILLATASCSFGNKKEPDFVANGMKNYLKEKYQIEDIVVENVVTERAKKYNGFSMKPFSHATFVYEGKTYNVVAYQEAEYKTYYIDDYEKEIIVEDIKKYFEKDFKDEPVFFNIDYYSKKFKDVKEIKMASDFPDEYFSCMINEKYTGDVVDFFSSHKWVLEENTNGIFLNITVGFDNVKTINYKLKKDAINLWVSYMNILNFKDTEHIINKNFRISENLAYIYPYLTEFYVLGNYSNNPTIRINGYQNVTIIENDLCSYIHLGNKEYEGQEISLLTSSGSDMFYSNDSSTFYYVPIKKLGKINNKSTLEIQYVYDNDGEIVEVLKTKADIKENLRYNQEYILVEGLAESENELYWRIIR